MLSQKEVKNNELSQLNPWRIICGFLFELDSYDIPNIIDKAGLDVNWSLSERENYSQKYRKDAFRTRINNAYNLVSNENKLRVSFTVAHELAKLICEEKLNDTLNTIGWKITNKKLFPEKQEVQELFLPESSQHDAYKEIRKIIQNIQNSINIIDPYIDSSIFTLLNTISSNLLNVSLLTVKYPNDFLVEANKYIAQYKTISLKIKKSIEFPSIQVFASMSNENSFS